MRSAASVAVLIALFVSSATGFAQIVEQSSEITPYVGVVSSRGVDVTVKYAGFDQSTTGEVESETSVLFGARYAYNVNTNSSLEGVFGIALPENAKAYLYHFNYRYNFTLSNEMVFPFVTGGVGAMTISPDEGESSTNLTFNFGGGFGYFVKENIAVRVDIGDLLLRKGDTEGTLEGQQVTVEGYTQHNIVATGGITYSFY